MSEYVYDKFRKLIEDYVEAAKEWTWKEKGYRDSSEHDTIEKNYKEAKAKIDIACHEIANMVALQLGAFIDNLMKRGYSIETISERTNKTQEQLKQYLEDFKTIEKEKGEDIRDRKERWTK